MNLSTLKKNKYLPTLAILLTVLFWGASSSAIKLALRDFPPYTLALLRFIIASSILYIIFKKREESIRIPSQDLFQIALSAFIGVTLYFILENKGIELTTAANASLMLASIPILTIIFDRVIYKSHFPSTTWIGVILSVIGVFFVISGSPDINFSSNNFWGNILVLGAALTWVIYSILQKPLTEKYSGLLLTTYQSIFGAIFLTPFALSEYKLWKMATPLGIANLLYLSLFCSALAYFLYIYAIANLGVTTTNIYINLLPIIGVITAYIVLKDTLLPVQMIGGLIIVIGIIVVSIRIKSYSLSASGSQLHAEKN